MKHAESERWRAERKNSMTELTVSMPAYNTGKYIGEAIESVLRQEGVDFELIVVDDGSQDDTAEVIQSFKDPRIRLIRNRKNMGISYCHNVVINESDSPFITHVDSDDLVLPGAFRKVVDTLKISPNVGQVHCYYFVINEDGKMRDSFDKRKKNLGKNIRPDMDYRRELLIRGGIMNHLRTYRREVFQVAGKFDEKLKRSEDYEMALRILDKYDIKLVPEFLYCLRIHKGNTTQSLRFKEIRFWFQRLIFCRRLLKSGKVHFLKRKEYNMNRLMILGLCHALLVLTGRLLVPILNRIYNSTVGRFSRIDVH